MSALGIASVLPVNDLPRAVAQWREVLGKDPTFVDGERWAQFDTPAGRLCLAGTDRTSGQAGVMVKVADLAAARETAAKLGWDVSAIETGPHEQRFVATAPPATPVTFYAPAPR